MRTPQEVAKSIENIVKAMNSLSIEEIDYFYQEVSRDEAIGPLIDPTLWRDTNRFAVASGSKRVLQAIRNLKLEVSGIGKFDSVAKAEGRN